MDADTSITATEEATADAVEVGRCLTAQGETDDTGAVTAASIAVSDPTDGECSLGMGGPGGMGGAPTESGE